MSYIFEALKKLEQKRQREGVSRLLMVTGEVARERKRWPFWSLSVLSVLLLLNAGVMIWWVHPWSSHGDPAATQPPPTAYERPAEAAANNPQRTQGAKEQSSDVKRVARPKAAGGSEATVAGKQAPESSRTEHAPGTRPASPEPQVGSERPVVAAGRVLDLKELPPAIKSELPELRISALYYTAEPQSRFTKINEQTLREGQILAPGAKLEEITADGVVLSYRGYRFQVGISDNR